MRSRTATWMILLAATTALAQPATQAFDSASFWLSQAQGNAAKISDPAERAGVFTAIATDWLAVPDPNQAQAAISSAEGILATLADPAERLAGFLAAAGVRERIGPGQGDADVQSAMSAVAQLPAGAAHDAAARQVARIQQITGGYAVAAPQVNAITDPVARAAAITDLAIAYSQQGPSRSADYQSAITDAAAAAEKVPDLAPWANARLQVIQARVRAGDFDGASAAAKAMDDRTSAEAQTIVALGYAQANQPDQAKQAVQKLVNAAATVPESVRAVVWLNIARVKAILGDKAGAKSAVETGVLFASHLDTADRADDLISAAQMMFSLGDAARAQKLAGDAATAVHEVVKPADMMDLEMSLAALQAQLGQGTAARQTVSDATGIAAKLPADQRHSDGDPAPADQLNVIRGAAGTGDFATALALAAGVTDASAHHDAILAIAAAQIAAGQYQAAEDIGVHEGPDAQAAVCGLVAASLARTRSPEQAEQWVVRLSNASDLAAANLAVGQVVMGKGKGGSE